MKQIKTHIDTELLETYIDRILMLNASPFQRQQQKSNQKIEQNDLLKEINQISVEIQYLFFTEVHTLSERTGNHIFHINNCVIKYKIFSNNEPIGLACAQLAFLKFRAATQAPEFSFYKMTESEFYLVVLLLLGKFTCDVPFNNKSFEMLNISEKYHINDLELIFLYDLGLIDSIKPNKAEWQEQTWLSSLYRSDFNNSNEIPERIAPDLLGLKKLFFQVISPEMVTETKMPTPVKSTPPVTTNYLPGILTSCFAFMAHCVSEKSFAKIDTLDSEHSGQKTPQRKMQ